MTKKNAITLSTVMLGLLMFSCHFANGVETTGGEGEDEQIIKFMHQLKTPAKRTTTQFNDNGDDNKFELKKIISAEEDRPHLINDGNDLVMLNKSREPRSIGWRNIRPVHFLGKRNSDDGHHRHHPRRNVARPSRRVGQHGNRRKGIYFRG